MPEDTEKHYRIVDIYEKGTQIQIGKKSDWAHFDDEITWREPENLEEKIEALTNIIYDMRKRLRQLGDDV